MGAAETRRRGTGLGRRGNGRRGTAPGTAPGRRGGGWLSAPTRARGSSHRGRRTDDTRPRSDDHHHAPAFHHGALFDHRDVSDRLDDAVEHGLPRLGVDDLAAAENDDELALVPLAEEVADVFDLEIEVVLVGLRAELDLLEHDRRLVAARGFLLLRRLVLELAEVHDLADRRCGPWIDLDQLQPQLLGEAQRLVGGDDADLGAVGADDAHLGHSDTAANPVVVRRAGRGSVIWPWDVLSPWWWLLSQAVVSSGRCKEPSL